MQLNDTDIEASPSPLPLRQTPFLNIEKGSGVGGVGGRGGGGGGGEGEEGLGCEGGGTGEKEFSRLAGKSPWSGSPASSNHTMTPRQDAGVCMFVEDVCVCVAYGSANR